MPTDFGYLDDVLDLQSLQCWICDFSVHGSVFCFALFRLTFRRCIAILGVLRIQKPSSMPVLCELKNNCFFFKKKLGRLKMDYSFLLTT